MSKRIVFGFDDKSLEGLEFVEELGRFSSKAEVVRETIFVYKELLNQAREGFSRIIVENPEDGRQRVIVIPTLGTLQNKKERKK